MHVRECNNKRIAQLFISSVRKQNSARIIKWPFFKNVEFIVTETIFSWRGLKKSLMIWTNKALWICIFGTGRTRFTLLTLAHGIFVMYTWVRVYNLLKEMVYLHHDIKHIIYKTISIKRFGQNKIIVGCRGTKLIQPSYHIVCVCG